MLDLHRLKEEKNAVELEKLLLQKDNSRYADAGPRVPLQGCVARALLAAGPAVTAVDAPNRLQGTIRGMNEELQGLQNEILDMREQAKEHQEAMKDLEQLRAERAALVARVEAAERQLEDGKDARAAQVNCAGSSVGAWM